MLHLDLGKILYCKSMPVSLESRQHFILQEWLELNSLTRTILCFLDEAI
jgi:hypothetical protein